MLETPTKVQLVARSVLYLSHIDPCSPKSSIFASLLLAKISKDFCEYVDRSVSKKCVFCPSVCHTIADEPVH